MLIILFMVSLGVHHLFQRSYNFLIVNLCVKMLQYVCRLWASKPLAFRWNWHLKETISYSTQKRGSSQWFSWHASSLKWIIWIRFVIESWFSWYDELVLYTYMSLIICGFHIFFMALLRLWRWNPNIPASFHMIEAYFVW